jgi:hypothetical protein
MSTSDIAKANSKYHILDLLAEIELTDPDTYRLSDELMPNDRIILDISEDTWLRKAFCLACYYRRETGRIDVDIELFERAEDKRMREILNYRAILLNSLAWYVLYSHYNLWGRGLVMPMRRGWKITEFRSLSHKRAEEGQ